MGADALFTVSNLVITSVFPESRQALAGSVFQTVSLLIRDQAKDSRLTLHGHLQIVQLGKAVGLATIPILATSVTDHSSYANKSSSDALFEGYRASFWLCFAETIVTVLISAWGLRLIGKVGMKRE